MGVIASFGLAIGWCFTRSVDWLTLVEALNLRLSHPVIAEARIAFVFAMAGAGLMAADTATPAAVGASTGGAETLPEAFASDATGGVEIA